MGEGIDVLLPKQVSDMGTTALSNRPGTLEGKTLGFIWNSKPNADALFDEFVAQVEKDYTLAGVKRHLKPNAAVGAVEPVLDEFAKECEAAVVALGD